jgi:hypothetical protein
MLMTPSLWIGLLLVTLVLLAGAAEIYAERRRRGELRERFKLEYSGQLRTYERLRRAEAVLTARKERLERPVNPFAGRPEPVAIPVLAHEDSWRVSQPPFGAEPIAVLEAD